MPSPTLQSLADLVGGVVHGDGALPINGAATIRDAAPGDITLADSPKLSDQLKACAAAAVVVSGEFTPSQPHIVVEDVHKAFAQIVRRFKPPSQETNSGVSPAATISDSCVLGENVTIYPGAYLSDGVRVGDNTVIHAGVTILAGTTVGGNTTIYPQVTIYEDTVVGDHVTIHANAIIGSPGFGYNLVQGKHKLSAQLGGVIIEDEVEIGAGCTIDRGAYTPTVIGAGTKLDNQVQIGHNVRIGRHNLICAQVGIAGSTSTGDYVVLAGQVGLADHIHLGDQVQVAAKAGVMTDVPAKAKYLGAPAQPMREFFVIQGALQRLPAMRQQLRALQKTVDALTKAEEAPSNKEAA